VLGLGHIHYTFSVTATNSTGTSVASQPSDLVRPGDNPCVPGPGLDLRRCDFSSRTIANADFSGADLSDAWFNGATVTNSNLANANLTGAHLEGADFDNSNLSGVILNQAALQGTKLGTANLTGATGDSIDGLPSTMPPGWFVEGYSLLHR